MSRRRNTARPGARGVAIDGVYASLLKAERHRCSRPDPRVHVGHDTKTAPAPMGHTKLLAMLEAEVPVAIPRWRVGGNHFAAARSIPWIAGRSCPAIIVWPDDTVEPSDADRH